MGLNESVTSDQEKTEMKPQIINAEHFRDFKVTSLLAASSDQGKRLNYEAAAKTGFIPTFVLSAPGQDSRTFLSFSDAIKAYNAA